MPIHRNKRTGGRTPLPVIELDGSAGATSVVTADVQLKISGEPLRLAITVPSGAAHIGDLLPVFQGLTDVVVGIGIRQVERQGARVSCRAGCGACCRQPVPILESETRHLKRLVDEMPEPRRTLVRERFAAAVRKLAETGLLDQVRDTTQAADVVALGLDYFRLGLACPFLQDESCSIHAQRPIACREYLVTSPAEECARPAEERVRGVPLLGRVGLAAHAVDRQPSGSRTGWVTLVLALEWVEAHPEEPPNGSGPDLLRAFLSGLAAGTA
jgi:Fe-S-cluster containining protein